MRLDQKWIFLNIAVNEADQVDQKGFLLKSSIFALEGIKTVNSRKI